MTPLQTPTGAAGEPDQAETNQTGPVAEPQTAAAPPPENPEDPRGRGRRSIGRAAYEYLEQHELVMLLDEINDERARARFREAVYLAIIFWLIFAVTVVYAPRYFWHPPHIVTAPDNEHRSTMTYLDTPPDLPKQLKRQTPTPNISTQTAESQSPKPSPKQMAEPKAGTPAPPARPTPTPQPQQQQAQQQPAPQPAQQQPQQQAKNTPPTPTPATPRPAPPVDAPSPSPNRNIFGGQQSAGQAIQQAARGSRSGADVGDYGSTGRGRDGGMKQGLQILSDTQGVDFSKYLQRLLGDVRRNWLPLIPEECRPPLNKQGITGVRFTILPDGRITAMNLDYSTHDPAIDRAAWGSITGLGQAQPLPKEFHGPNLELRIEFRINKDYEAQ